MAQEPKAAAGSSGASASATASAAGTAGQPRAPKLRYQDRPEITETFTDSIRSCVFDGQVMRIEFTVARFDDPGVLGVLEGRQVPVSRLVLSRTALNDLMGRLAQLGDVVKKAAAGAPAGAGTATSTADAAAAAGESAAKPTKQ